MELAHLRKAPSRRAAPKARPLDKASLRGRPFEGNSREERAARRSAASGGFQKAVVGTGRTMVFDLSYSSLFKPVVFVGFPLSAFLSARLVAWAVFLLCRL